MENQLQTMVLVEPEGEPPCVQLHRKWELRYELILGQKEKRRKVRTHFAHVRDRKHWIKHFALPAMVLA